MTARIRPAETRDGAALAAIYRPAVTASATSFELEPPDAREMARRVAEVTARTPWLVCELSDDVVGYAYAGPFRHRPAYQWTVEVSAYVRGDIHRRGVARALYTSLFAVLELQGFRNAVAGVTLPNPASVEFHAAMGFTPVGVYHGVGYKFGVWHDVAWFERAIGAGRNGEPTPPVPLPALEREALRAALDVGLGRLRLPAAGS